MKIGVDRDKCVGVGICEVTAPGVFEIDDHGDPVVLMEDVAAPQLEAVRAAVGACPAKALHLIDPPSDERIHPMSLTGTWHLSIDTPMGRQKVELELVQDGAQITGVSRNDLEGEQPLKEPVLSGNQLSWKSTITRPIKVTAKMEVTFDGDSLTGTARAGMFPPATITGRREA